MNRETFILTQNKDFRRSVRVFLKGKDNKIDARRVKFTTEHKVSEKDRNKRARLVPAEFSTSDEVIYDALLRSTAYGKTFLLKDDPKGELKREPIDVTPMDAKKIALKNLFEQSGLPYDNKKSSEVLEQEYQIYSNANSGTKIAGSGPSTIPHTPIDVEKQLLEQVNAAREAYKVKYNEEIPAEFANDKALLSALSDPEFDAEMDAWQPTIDDSIAGGGAGEGDAVLG